MTNNSTGDNKRLAAGNAKTTATNKGAPVKIATQ